MNLRKRWNELAAAIFCIGALASVACSGSNKNDPMFTEQDGGPSGAPHVHGGHVGRDGGARVQQPGPGTMPPGTELPVMSDLGCAAQADAIACDKCCVDAHPDGDGFEEAQGDLCICAPTACRDACATSYCSPDGRMPPGAGDACDTCRRGMVDTCAQSAAVACAANAECKAIRACREGAACATKPPPPSTVSDDGSSGTSASSGPSTGSTPAPSPPSGASPPPGPDPSDLTP
jgi:hypothetical protein